MTKDIKEQFIKNISSMTEDEVVMLLTHMRTHAHDIQDLKISRIYNNLVNDILGPGPKDSRKKDSKVNDILGPGPKDAEKSSVDVATSPVEDGQSEELSLTSSEEELSEEKLGQLRYSLTLKSLHGTKRLDFIVDRNEKITDLFNQMDKVKNLFCESGVIDRAYIASLENDFRRLYQWAKDNKTLFSPKQWRVVQTKVGAMLKLRESKETFLQHREDNELQGQLKYQEKVIENLKKKLLQHGIPLQETGKTDIKDFDQEKALEKLWFIINTNFEIKSAEDKLDKWLTEEYTGAWMGDENIIRFYNKAVTTIRTKVSVERFNEKKSLTPSKPAVTKKDIDKWCDELQTLEDKGDYDTYTSKFEEYRKSAASAGYSEYFKKTLDNVDQKKAAAGLLPLLDKDVLSGELMEYFAKDNMELTQEGMLKRYIKAKDYALCGDTNKLYDLFQQNVRQSFKDTKEQDRWFNMWITGLHPKP